MRWLNVCLLAATALAIDGCGHGGNDAPPPYAPNISTALPYGRSDAGPYVPAAAPASHDSQLPTATEVFNLRSECAKLGEKLMHAAVHAPALRVTQISSYEPKTNRCHVQLTTQTADRSKPNQYLLSSVYDGQTGRMLASYQIDDQGIRSGQVFGQGEIGFEASKLYGNELMKDD